jgi:hypothetical protein
MNIQQTDLAAEYLREVDQRLAGLPVLLRRELLADLCAHIETERVERNLSEGELIEVLERLGSPEVIAAAAHEEAVAQGWPGRTVDAGAYGRPSPAADAGAYGWPSPAADAGAYGWGSPIGDAGVYGWPSPPSDADAPREPARQRRTWLYAGAAAVVMFAGFLLLVGMLFIARADVSVEPGMNAPAPMDIAPVPEQSLPVPEPTG